MKPDLADMAWASGPGGMESGAILSDMAGGGYAYWPLGGRAAMGLLGCELGKDCCLASSFA